MSVTLLWVASVKQKEEKTNVKTCKHAFNHNKGFTKHRTCTYNVKCEPWIGTLQGDNASIGVQSILKVDQVLHESNISRIMDTCPNFANSLIWPSTSLWSQC